MTESVLQSKLVDLGLQGMARMLNVQLNQPKSMDRPYVDLLRQLVDTEWADRNTRKIARLTKDARFRYPSACIEDLDEHPSRKLDRSLVFSLADAGWIRRNQGLILLGATGTGKSWLACALGMQACRLGLSAYFTTAQQLFEDVRLATADGTLPKLRRKLTKVALLIVDDLGLGGIGTDVGPALLEIVDKQSAVGALLITSQYPVESWHSLFSDGTIADAILDRVVHRSHHIDLKGGSLRKRRPKGE